MEVRLAVYSRSHALLQSYANLFERSGWHVLLADSLELLTTTLDRNDIDLTIFCYSLLTDLREQAIAIVNVLGSGIPLIVRAPGSFEGDPAAIPSIFDAEMLCDTIRKRLAGPAIS